jgi:dTDP-4-amino-4,6-dideoxygalactose transaminase
MSPAFAVVAEFERQVAAFAGAKHGIAVDSCTSALFLSMKYSGIGEVVVPAQTYISVPMSVLHAGGSVCFQDFSWSGAYQLEPAPIWDSAKRFRRGMYEGGLYCVSFHIRKLLGIGRGGMVLTDDERAAAWLRRARFDGRNGDVPFMQDKVEQLGWNCYMLPEQAARGLQLLEGLRSDALPDLYDPYPDLREMPIFKNNERVRSA